LDLDYGCRIYHEEDRSQRKKFLLLEEEQYSTQKAKERFSQQDIDRLPIPEVLKYMDSYC
jgi:hypothetical protein